MSYEGRMEIASNGARILFKRPMNSHGREEFEARLMDGHWPGSDELIELADGGGEFAAYFGGRVEDRPDGTKLVTVHTQ
jgi:hypothetical protein